MRFIRKLLEMIHSEKGRGTTLSCLQAIPRTPSRKNPAGETRKKMASLKRKYPKVTVYREEQGEDIL